ncbi:MAG: response regulator [Spirochaetaceae bacterium]|nr:response regulator [Spirochaetaceae bacterium]
MSDITEKKKILMIDDTDFHLSIAKNMLKNDYEVITARSGKEGLDYLLKGLVPDIILLDIIMPNMDGWETSHKIRGISLLQDVPIAFLTSSSEAEDVKYAQQIGAADYIIKPYEKNDFLKRIKNIIEKYHKRK